MTFRKTSVPALLVPILVLLALCAGPGAALADDGAQGLTVGAGELQVQAKTVASGKWGTCPWKLTDDGTLTISSGKGSNTKGKSPWDKQIYSKSITKVVFKGNVIAPADISGLFYRRNYPGDAKSHITSIDFSGFDTRHTKNMSSMLWNQQDLRSITWGKKFKTSNVTDMHEMFYYCCFLNDLDLSCFDTSKVRDMSEMFLNWSAGGDATLDLSGFDTSRVTHMRAMFERAYPKSIDLSGWNTGCVTDMSNMFYGCNYLTTIDVSHFKTRNLRSTSYMFGDCVRLKAVSFPAWKQVDTLVEYKVWMDGMFSGCYNLRTIYSNNWVFDKLFQHSISPENMFKDCKKLKGGNGTKCSSNHVGGKYARVDTKTSPGYFTEPKSVGKAKVTVEKKSYTYTGKNIKPKVTVKLGGKTLKEGADYLVSYKDNKKIGTATVIVEGLFHRPLPRPNADPAPLFTAEARFGNS